MTIANANQLIEDNEIAFLHADICLASPDSYSLDEKRQICENIDATNAAIDAAMRKDFQELPPHAQAKMLDLLQKADPEHFDWWRSLLAEPAPDAL